MISHGYIVQSVKGSYAVSVEMMVNSFTSSYISMISKWYHLSVFKTSVQTRSHIQIGSVHYPVPESVYLR